MKSDTTSNHRCWLITEKTTGLCFNLNQQKCLNLWKLVEKSALHNMCNTCFYIHLASQAMNTTNQRNENRYIFCGIPRVLLKSWLNFSLYFSALYGVEWILRYRWQTSISLKDNLVSHGYKEILIPTGILESIPPLQGELSIKCSTHVSVEVITMMEMLRIHWQHSQLSGHGWITRKEWIATCKS